MKKYKDPEKRKEYLRQYRLKNKEKLLQQSREYYNTESCKKLKKICKWKQYGILCFDYNLLYDLFLSTSKCEYCNCELTTDRYNTSTTKCLDHDHTINDKFNVRGVLCNSCNVKDVLK